MTCQSTQKEKCDFSLCFIFNDVDVIENGGTALYRGNSELIRVSLDALKGAFNVSVAGNCMGLLDQLRQETDSVKKAEQAEKDRVAELERVYAEKVLPKLEKLYSFLKELEKHLNYLNPDISVDYEIPGLGRLVQLKQGKYEMDKGRSGTLTRVPFRFCCEGEETLRGLVEGPHKVNAILEELTRAKVRYESKTRRDNDNQVYGATIEVLPRVTVCITFIGVKETGGIELHVQNYDNLSKVRSFLNPSQITEEFIEELGKFIMRKPNRFLKQELSEDQKSQLAEMVRKAKEERDEELREAEEKERLEQLKRRKDRR